MRDAGHKGRKSAQERHEARRNDGDAAVALIKRMCLVKGFFIEPARALPLKHLGPDVPPDAVVALVAKHRRNKQQANSQRIAHQANAAHRAHDKQQRVARQERHDDQAGLDKNDDKQQRINPDAIAGDKHLKMLVNVKNEIDEKGGKFHGGDFDRSAGRFKRLEAISAVGALLTSLA